jgi:hypothetical protein
MNSTDQHSEQQNHKRLIISILSLFVLFAASIREAKAQAVVALSPNARQQFFLANGSPNAGGCLFTYSSGTSTPLATYTDYSGLYQNTNPIILDASGSAPIYLTNANYRFVLYSAGGTNCSQGSQIWLQDNVNAWQTFNNLTELQFTPVTLDPTGSQGMLDFNSTPSTQFPNGCLKVFAGSWQCLQFASSTTTTSPVYIIDPTLSPYNAACDGVTDDSTALQSAISAAISTKQPLQLPAAKTCVFGTGLTGSGGFTMYGFYKVGSGTSVAPNLKYTGSGIALNINNGISFLYNVNLNNFYLVNSNSSSQTGIACTYCNTLFIDGVQVGGPTAATGMQTAFDFSNSAGIDAESIQEFNAGTAFRLVNTTNVNVNACNTFANSVVFLLGGSTPGNSGVNIHDCLNIEAQNYVLDWDDANPVSSITIGNSLQFQRNYVLFDGGTSTYPNQQFVHISNTGTNFLQLLNTVLTGNNILCAAGGLCSSAYAINMAISGTTNASTDVVMTIEQNKFSGFSSGGITSNGSSHSNVVWANNYNDAPANVNGTGNFCVETFSSGTLNLCPLSVAGTITTAGGLTDTSLLTSLKRIHWSGTLVTSANFSASAGWGTGASCCTISGVSPYDSSGAITLTSGTSTSANPTITFTFADGTGANNVVCSANRIDTTNDSIQFRQTGFSTTSATWTFVGTPAASTSYGLNWHCDFH